MSTGSQPPRRVLNDTPFEPTTFVIRGGGARPASADDLPEAPGPREAPGPGETASGFAEPTPPAPSAPPAAPAPPAMLSVPAPPPSSAAMLPPRPRSPAPRVGGETDDTRDIEQQLEQTRAAMGGTIDAIQERLRPKRLIDEAREAARDAAVGLFDDAKASVRDATIGKAERMARDVKYRAEDTRSSLMDTIKDNPVPAALAGLSLGWLWMNRGSSRRRSADAYGYRAYGGPRYVGYESERGGLGEVVGEARERVSRVADQARDTAGDLASTAGDVVGTAGERAGEVVGFVGERATGAGSTLWETVSQNPIPSALVAVGLGWLLRSAASGDGDADAYPRGSGRYPYAYDTAGYAYRSGYQMDNFESDGLRGRVAGAAEGVVDRAGDVVEDVAERAGEAAEQVDAWRRSAGRRAGRARGQLESWFYERPLAAGAIALGVGAALGMAAPSTEPEGRLMGEARETLLERAQETAQDAQQKVQRVAEEATHAAKREAKAQDLTTSA